MQVCPVKIAGSQRKSVIHLSLVRGLSFLDSSYSRSYWKTVSENAWRIVSIDRYPNPLRI